MPLEVPESSNQSDDTAPVSPITAAAMAARIEKPARRGGGSEFDDMRALLVSILPDAEEPVQVLDLRGRSYSCQPYLPLRREFKLKEWFRSLSIADQGAFLGLSGMDNAAIARSLLSFKESLIDQMDVAFELCHGGPGEILEQARAAEAEIDSSKAASQHRPSDLFRGGQMIRAVLPFCVAPLIEMIDLATPLVRLASR